MLVELAKNFRFDDLIGPLLEEHELRRKVAASGLPTGPVTGFPELDAELGGSLIPGVHVLQAAPGAGKTAFGLQVGAASGFPALFVSAEMGPLPLFSRAIARQTNTPLSYIRAPDLTIEELEVLAESTASELPQFVILDATISAAPPEQMIDISQGIQSLSGKLPLVIVDSIQPWARSTGPLGYVNEYEMVARATRLLVEIASKLGVPVLAIAQRNRAGQEKGGLHASKGAGDIEYGAESVLELRRDLSSQPDAKGEVEVEILILKNRNGSPGATVHLLFNGATQSFRPASPRRRRR